MFYPGLDISGYIIVEELGRGAFGSVFLAKEKYSGRPVAIKFLHPRLSRSEDIKQNFLDEMINQARLSNNPNIVGIIRSIRYVDNKGEHLGMVMEFVDGEPLDFIIHKYGFLPDYAALPIFLQVLNGIEFAHGYSILHRDIKPGNIMINVRGVVKIMDFGLSKLIPTSILTRDSLPAAALNYTAPERFDRKPIDRRTDIYSLGATFFEVLTGHTPYNIKPEDWEDAKNKHKSGNFRDIREYYQGHSQEMEWVIRKSLCPDPSRRYDNCHEMKRDLLVLLNKCPMPDGISAEFRLIHKITLDILENRYIDVAAKGLPEEQGRAVRPGASPESIRLALAELQRREEEARTRERITFLGKQVVAHFNAREYQIVQEEIDELSTLGSLDSELAALQERTHRIIELRSQILYALTHQRYQDLLPLYARVQEQNENDQEAAQMMEFLGRAVSYLTGGIKEKISRQEMSHSEAIKELVSLVKSAPPPFRDELQNLQKELIQEKKELDRQERLLQMQDAARQELHNDNYEQAVRIIRKAEEYVSNPADRFFPEEQCWEAKKTIILAEEALQIGDFSRALDVFRKLTDLNPLSSTAASRIKIIENYLQFRAEMMAASSPYQIHKKILIARSGLEHLPVSMARELNTWIKEKSRMIEEEKQKLKSKAHSCRERKKLLASLRTFYDLRDLQEDPAEMQESNRQILLTKKQLLAKIGKWVALIASGLALSAFILYMATGPIPTMVRLNHIRSSLQEAKKLIAQEEYESLMKIVRRVAKIRPKLKGNKFIDLEINNVFQEGYAKLTDRSERKEAAGDMEGAIADAQLAVMLAGQRSAEANGRFKKLNCDLYSALGNAKLKEKNYLQAAAYYETAYTYCPLPRLKEAIRNATYLKHFSSGQAYIQNRDYVSALRDFRKAEQILATPQVLEVIDQIEKTALIQQLTADMARAKAARDYDQWLKCLIDIRKAQGQFMAVRPLMNEIAYQNSQGQPEIKLKSIDFVFVPAGEFDMGCFNSSDSSFLKDAPVHKVRLISFWISKYEITQAQFRVGKMDRPVTVSWTEASDFARKFGKSLGLTTDLPTEAQWEYAARNGGEKVSYPWGEENPSCDKANFKDCVGSVRSVGFYPPNKLGICELSGNLREWCRDVYSAGYYSLSENSLNPLKFTGGDKRVIRGGSFADVPLTLKTYLRDYKQQDQKDDFTGYRVVIE